MGTLSTQYTLMSFFILPNKVIDIAVKKNNTSLSFMLNDTGEWVTTSKWTAPKVPGMYTITLQVKDEPATTLQIFVLHPMSQVKNKKLNGYTIGSYPKELYKGRDIYKHPEGFVEVTADNKNTLVSPHYTLGQFLCKQNEGYPKYLVLQTKLLNKLEFLTEAVNQEGITMNSFTVMSGYRTPFYNAAINNSRYSRHQWGGASDIYVDENPKDGMMDDLNGDGKINVDDARFLTNMIEEFYETSPDYKRYIGGLGLYRANSAHGPFIHVDVRGSRARW